MSHISTLPYIYQYHIYILYIYACMYTVYRYRYVHIYIHVYMYICIYIYSYITSTPCNSNTRWGHCSIMQPWLWPAGCNRGLLCFAQAHYGGALFIACDYSWNETWDKYIYIYIYTHTHTPQRFNIATQNDALEDVSPFKYAYFWVSILIFVDVIILVLGASRSLSFFF